MSKQELFKSVSFLKNIFKIRNRLGLFQTGIILLFFFISCQQQKQENPGYLENQDTIQILKNDSVTLNVSLWGGALTSFSLNNQNLNPLEWKLTPEEMPENNRNGAPFQGHFLCFGRWGGPTSGEIASGIPHNGEPANQWWNLEDSSNPEILKMSFKAPLENWQINRTIRLEASQLSFTVEETFFNPEKFGRFTTVVQHATLGGEFLNENTVVNSNAGEGFNQALISRSLDEYAYSWPDGYSDTLQNKIDLRQSGYSNGFVTTHIINDTIGWVTAATPDKNLLVGYVWKTADYPWLHIWHGTKNGKVWAKGLEFGTTGLGDTFSPQERLIHSFKGRENYFFVDAVSGVTKRYTCFLLPVENDFIETKQLVFDGREMEMIYLTKTGIQSIKKQTNF
jgi:hypothetical protein